MLSNIELERYKRQLMHDEFNLEHQNKLKQSTALIAGIGGLGGTVAFYLAAAGIGKLILLHEGNLTHSNLNRQILMTNDWVGKSRAIKGKETLEKFNPYVEIDSYDEPVEVNRLLELSNGVDVIIDCRHNFPERRRLNQASLKTKIPLIESAMNAFEGYLFNIFPGITPCLDCIYPDDPDWDPFGFPVIGAVPGTLGSITALETIKILTRYEEPMVNEMLYFDLGNYKFQKFQLYKAEDCQSCKHIY